VNKIYTIIIFEMKLTEENITQTSLYENDKDAAAAIAAIKDCSNTKILHIIRGPDINQN